MDEMVKAGYHYRPLVDGEIRLIQLLPGQDIEEIRCSIIHVLLAADPSYEAISYSWGDPTATITIWCDDAPLEVTESLYSALLRLRYHSRPRTLWADAICINQLNIEERNCQLQHMRDIFHKSQSVIIWLGEGDYESDRAMSFVPQLANYWETKASIDDLHGGDIPGQHNPQGSIFFKLLQRPWFARVWVVQEVAVSSQAIVVCGRATAAWENFYRAAEYTIQRGNITRAPREKYGHVINIEGFRKNFAGGIEQQPVDQLFSCRALSASDPRDKVFAAFGFFSSSHSSNLDFEPNYLLNTNQVYKRLATAALRITCNLDVLSIPRVQETSYLPTWVPDWSISDQAYYLPLLWRLIGENSNRYAAGPVHYSPDFSANGDQLKIAGHFVDRILKIGYVLEFNCPRDPSAIRLSDAWTLSFADQKILINWEEICGVFSKKDYPTGEAALDAYWKTLITGLFRADEVDNLREDFLSFSKGCRMARYVHKFHLYSSKKVLYTSLLLFLLALVLRGKSDAFFKSLTGLRTRITAEHRRMIKTEKGYIGLAPRLAQVGDQIGLFKGGKMPLILRPHGSNWQLIGDSYIHGIMRGEGFEENKCKDMWLV